MADEPTGRAPVERVPTTEGDVSAIASATAPVIFFDEAPVFACFDGVVRVTLEVVRYQRGEAKVGFDRVIVGHLRMSLPAARQLRDVIDKALLHAALPAGADAAKPN